MGLLSIYTLIVFIVGFILGALLRSIFDAIKIEKLIKTRADDIRWCEQCRDHEGQVYSTTLKKWICFKCYTK